MLGLDFKQLSYDARWHEFDATGEAPFPRLKIRPFPASMGSATITDKGMVLSGEDRLERFCYCLVDWDGVVDAETQAPIKLTDEIKRKVFDFDLAGIPAFVLSKGREWEIEKDADEKN